VVPTLTVRVPGVKVKLTMLIVLPEIGWVEVFVVDAPFPDEHADKDTTAIKEMIINIARYALFK